MSAASNFIDNARPDDPDYPTAPPPKTAYHPDGTEVIVRVGDYIVNREGDMVIATTSNAGPWPNDFLRELNGSYFRARYIGNSGDYGEMANQSRLATAAEIERAKSYRQNGFKVNGEGQAILL